MKLTEKQIEFVNKYTQKIMMDMGMIDWKLNLKCADNLGETSSGGITLAETDGDFYEKKIDLTVSSAFFKEKVEARKNILFHEIIHINIILAQERFEAQTKSIKYEIEEELANALAKAYQNR